MACAQGEAVALPVSKKWSYRPKGLRSRSSVAAERLSRRNDSALGAGPAADELDLQRGSQELFRDSLAEFHRFGLP